MISWLAGKAKKPFRTAPKQSKMRVGLLMLLIGSLCIPIPAFSDNPPTTANPNEYILDAGDEIRIEDAVIGNLTSMDPANDKASQDSARINDDGLIDLPLIGPIRLSGLPLGEAQKLLTRKYQGLLQQPDITIHVVTQHPVRVYVQGAVNTPGVYINGKNTQPEIKDYAGLGGVSNTEIYSRYYLTDALIQAGGLKANADYQNIRIYRGFPNPQVIQVNLWQLFQQGNAAGDIPLEEHDRVEVPTLPANQLALSDDWKNINRTNVGVGLFQVNVIGAVKQPGSYPLSARDNVLAAIAQAGGLMPFANPKSVFLLRANDNGQVFKKRLDASDARLMANGYTNWPNLLPGDVIFVDDSKGRQALSFGKTLIDRTAGAALLPFFSSLSTGTNQ